MLQILETFLTADFKVMLSKTFEYGQLHSIYTSPLVLQLPILTSSTLLFMLNM